nr:unnamed protein product [uncultured bacterium]
MVVVIIELFFLIGTSLIIIHALYVIIGIRLFVIIVVIGEVFMDGFRIDYITFDGVNEITWFGSPVSSFDLSGASCDDMKDIFLMMFSQAYSGCKVVSIKPCSLEDFEKIKG